jgi:hypothetical protein
VINKPASVRARLLNKAKAENRDFSLVLIAGLTVEAVSHLSAR